MSTHRQTVTFTGPQFEFLQREAERLGLSVSDLVRRIIDSYREKERSLRDQCADNGVPFFLKQHVVNGKKIPLPELDGKQWAEVPLITRF